MEMKWRMRMEGEAPRERKKELEPAELEKRYGVLRNEKAQLPEIRQALFDILEKVGNNNDCFWISHGWAESLITGKTIARDNFPEHSALQVKVDPAWKKDRPDYKGAHLSQGAEAYMVTDRTRGKNKDLPPREYKNFKTFGSLQELKDDLRTMKKGELKMVFPLDKFGIEGAGGHAMLIARIQGELVVIDNAFDPGAWLKSWPDFAHQQEKTKQFAVYDYPEKIHSL